VASIDLHTPRDLSEIFTNIGQLFERAQSVDAERPTRANVEALLTEGYGEALALELELGTIDRRLGDLFTDGANPAGGSRARELRTLGAWRFHRQRELGRLRSLLEELRAYGDSLLG
jgi:hypothetical protein